MLFKTYLTESRYPSNNDIKEVVAHVKKNPDTYPWPDEIKGQRAKTIEMKVMTALNSVAKANKVTIGDALNDYLDGEITLLPNDPKTKQFYSVS